MSEGPADRLAALREQLRQFVAEREWSRFHDPKNLAMALSSEAGELLAELRWISSDEADAFVRDQTARERIETEVGDIAIALILFCERAGIDVFAAAEKKLRINAANYPVESSRGRSDRPVAECHHEFSRVIAVDWSGAVGGGQDTIWLAEVIAGELTALESGRSRADVIERLIELAAFDPNIVVGFDFAFAFPHWFAESRGLTEVGGVWELAAKEGETWLRDCQSPFWGRPGKTKPSLPSHLRDTDVRVGRQFGGQPKSAFQIGGAGAVGTGSIRGMAHLLRLRDAGFSIWPFDPPRRPIAIEIYPRLLTGPVVKSNWEARSLHLATNFSTLSTELRTRAASTEDSFDAAVSALVMWRHAADLALLSVANEPIELIEGRIWAPQSAS